MHIFALECSTRKTVPFASSTMYNIMNRDLMSQKNLEIHAENRENTYVKLFPFLRVHRNRKRGSFVRIYIEYVTSQVACISKRAELGYSVNWAWLEHIFCAV